ncbi:hypothetical protein DdX_04855 [Ditylenchus destructor]|uniref:Uncharacterized protein n=1 Tax=Ditylenchus destructor TaxID=166010 RepID=A0AAD4N8L8_9BILA|nr:hypothetical protein DdX_04855 [Ditylenchus destructor]
MDSTDLVLGIISLFTLLIVLLVFCNCYFARKSEKRTVIKDRQYIESIHRLLERQEAIEHQREQQAKFQGQISPSLPKTPLRIPSRPATPSTYQNRRQRSHSATQHPEVQKKLARLRDDLAQFKVDHGVQISQPCSSHILRSSSSAPIQRRTWDEFRLNGFEDIVRDDVQTTQNRVTIYDQSRSMNRRAISTNVHARETTV